MTDTYVNRIRLMSPAGQHFDTIFHLSFGILFVAIVITFFAFFQSLSIGARITEITSSSTLVARHDITKCPDLRIIVWTVFQNNAMASDQRDGALSKRFRLAGTFFAFGGVKGDSRKAIIDNLADSTQSIISENDMLGDVRVSRILRDRVVFIGPAGEEELWLVFSDAKTLDETSKNNDPEKSALSGVTDRFGGRQMGENRWVFKRDALLSYYRELMDEPNRLVQIFDSLKPLYDSDMKITGYVLGTEGEQDFFDAVGIKEGDIVRSVNSMKMTNRRRAEYFISEFVQDRANVFDIVLERDGKEIHQMYHVR